MKNIVLLIAFSTSILLSQNITVFGGLNESLYIYNEDPNFDEGMDEGFVSGFNLGVEKKLGPAYIGLGLNQRGTQLNFDLNEYDGEKIEGFSHYKVNYFTIHASYPIDLVDNMTGFGGLQFGSSFGGELKSKATASYDGEEENREDTETIDADEFNFDYGIIFGTQYWLTEKVGLRASYYLGLADVFAEFEESGNVKNSTVSFSLIFGFGKKSSKSASGSGPSAKADKKRGGKGSAPARPKAVGNDEIDNFVTAAFDLNDEIIALKAKLENVSKELEGSNAVLSEIGKHPNGALGWASEQMSKGASKAVNNAKSLDVGSADALNPTQHLRKKLQTMKSGIVAGSTQLKSVPDDLKVIGEQSKSLISSAKALPKAAKSLGMKAPKALKVIKNTTDVLTKIPTEVTAIGNETKKVLNEIDQVLKNIESILSN